MNNFSDYYQRIIDAYSTGFKLVLGGTGLGKTSSAIEVIAQHPHKKFIYIANRIQLLNEFAEKLTNRGIAHNFQKSDYDMLALLTQDDVDDLFGDDVFVRYYKKLRNDRKVEPIKKYNDAYKAIKELAEIQQDPKYSIKSASTLSNITLQSSHFFRFVRKVISEANDEQGIEHLIQHPVIQQLFPFIPFVHNQGVDQTQVFLVTVQKAFHGFFDGQRVTSLQRLKSPDDTPPYIVLLDEFDFLENDLLDLIVSDVTIDSPFEFVARFYRQMKSYKMPYPKFLSQYPDERAAIDKILTNIEKLSNNYNINYPAINHFVCTDGEITGTSIFQTRNTIGKKPIFLNEHSHRQNSFQLVISPEKANLYTLLNTVNQSVTQIIRIFKDLEFSARKVHDELLYYCYKTADTFQRQIRLTRQVPYARMRTPTDDSKVYYNGFGLYEIQELSYISDPEQVDIRYFALFSTPEKILLELSKHNLVFGLSATANFDRYLKNFDLYWLKNELKERYYEIDKDDEDIVNALTTSKHNQRQNSLSVVKVGQPLDHSHNQGDYAKEKQQIHAWLYEHVLATDPLGIFGTGDAQRKFRVQRVAHFFNTLFMLLEQRQDHLKTDAHILFFNSFHQIETILKKYSRVCDDDLSGFLGVKNMAQDNVLFHYYEVRLGKQSFNIVFYNSQKAKDVYRSEKIKEEYYNLFWQDKPVILVTTYPSAGNGVNLQYFSTKEQYEQNPEKPDKDFTCLHLYDTAYYFFSMPTEDTELADESAVIKKNIYYLAKLEKNHLISIGRFRSYLSRIRQGGVFNTDYTKSDDALINQIAIFVQAIGRIERIWGKMDNQVIYLSTPVYNVFEKFRTHDDFVDLFEEVSLFFSNNLTRLFDYINAQAPRARIQRRSLSQSIDNENEKCKRSIKNMLLDLQRLRAGTITSDEEAQQIRKDWESLRDLALRHAFFKHSDPKKQSLLYQNHAVFETRFYDFAREGLWIDAQNKLLPAAQGDDKYQFWSMNVVYNMIAKNDTIRGHFELKRYQLGFTAKGKYFVPYFFQAILVGAIGEEAIKAILERESIGWTTEGIPNELYELADIKVEKAPWFIDCKNYSIFTVARFSLSPEDPLYRSKLNDNYFKKSAIQKLNSIQGFYKNEQDCKLIYINAFGDNDISIKYYKVDKSRTDLDRVYSFADAEIIVVPGMIQSQAPKEYCEDFAYFIQQLKS